MKQKAFSFFCMHFCVNRFLKKGPIFPTFFLNKRYWWTRLQHSILVTMLLKNLTQHSKTVLFKLSQKQPKHSIRLAIIVLFFLFLFKHFKAQWKRVRETTTNQQDVVLKISQHEIDYYTFNCQCNFQCWLFSL